MRSTQHLSARHRLGVATAVCMEREPSPDAHEDLVAAAVDALNEMGDIVSHECFASPETLTEDRVVAYALALMHLRERASAAGIERLMRACDALAVTVSRLIEDRSAACRGKCEALTRFVMHAKAMIRMSTENATRHTRPNPGIHNAS